MNTPFDLTGKTALVTGASRGLGRAMAEGLASAGAAVVCSSSREGGTDDTVAAIESGGGRAWSAAADLSDRSAADALYQRTRELAGHIHVLINNAGIIRRRPAVEFTMEDWDPVVETNLTAVFRLCQLFGRGMIARGSGKIINIASLLSFSGGITVPSYTATKHGVAGITKALANEWGCHNVQVNAIAPGYFRTDNTEALQNNPERFEEISRRIPASRWGETEDIAGAAVFLSSAASDYITGHVLTVDGGWMAR